MCIDWLFQQMLLSFDNNFDVLQEKAKSDDKFKDYVVGLTFVKTQVFPFFNRGVSAADGTFPHSFQMAKAQKTVQNILKYDFLAKAIIFISTAGTKCIEYKETGEFDIATQASILHMENQETKLKAENSFLMSLLGPLRKVTEVCFPIFFDQFRFFCQPPMLFSSIFFGDQQNLVEYQFPTQEKKKTMPESLKSSYNSLRAHPPGLSQKPKTARTITSVTGVQDKSTPPHKKQRESTADDKGHAEVCFLILPWSFPIFS